MLEVQVHVQSFLQEVNKINANTPKPMYFFIFYNFFVKILFYLKAIYNLLHFKAKIHAHNARNTAHLFWQDQQKYKDLHYLLYICNDYHS